MAESFFGLQRRPFQAVPSLDSYVPTSTCEHAIASAVRAVARAEGPSTIIGGAGLGKTICSMKIVQQFSKSMSVVFLSSSQLCTRRALLQAILYHLGLPHHYSQEGQLRLALTEYLTRSRGIPDTDSHPRSGVLLLIDEAQTLSVKLLDEIRLLTNTLRLGVPFVHLVLVGTIKLEDTLAHPQMESLNQRLVSRSYLTPLGYQETFDYVRSKIATAGGQIDQVFESSAVEAIYRASGGIPRLIDQLADHAILNSGSSHSGSSHTATEHRKPISADRIGAAWTQLHQLPNPWSEPEITRTATREEFPESESIEFGSLDEEPSASLAEQSDPMLPTQVATREAQVGDLPQTKNLFQSFFEEPDTPELAEVGHEVIEDSPAMDQAFQALLSDMHLSAIQ